MRNFQHILREKKTILAVLSILIIASLVYYILSKRSNDDLNANHLQSVSVMVVKPIDIPVIFKSTGVTRNSNTVEIIPRVSGIIEKVLFKEGAKVNKDDLLFQIETNNYELESKAAKAALIKAQTAYNKASRDLIRINALYDKKFISKKELDDAMSDIESAKADIELANVKIGEAKLNLNYTSIVSPIDGVISQALFKEGSYVSAQNKNILAKIAQVNPMYVDFNIVEADYLKSGNFMTEILDRSTYDKIKISISFDNQETYDHEGVIDYADIEFSPKYGSLQMRAAFTNPLSKLISGQFVKLVVKNGNKNAIIIPKKALIESTNGKYVYLINQQSRVEQKPIRIGDLFEDQVEVILGLSEDDKVVVEGLMGLVEGTEVKIISELPQDKLVYNLSYNNFQMQLINKSG